jgi:hypothetical protein
MAVVYWLLHVLKCISRAKSYSLTLMMHIIVEKSKYGFHCCVVGDTWLLIARFDRMSWLWWAWHQVHRQDFERGSFSQIYRIFTVNFQDFFCVHIFTVNFRDFSLKGGCSHPLIPLATPVGVITIYGSLIHDRFEFDLLETCVGVKFSLHNKFHWPVTVFHPEDKTGLQYMYVG